MPRFPLVFLLLVGVPVAEISLFVVVGGRLGLWITLGLVVLTAFIGASLFSRQGAATWQRAQRSLSQGQLPAREMVDGILILAAGLLLLTPGFLTDVVGFLLLTPPVRAILRAVLIRRFESRIVTHARVGFEQPPAADEPGGYRVYRGPDDEDPL